MSDPRHVIVGALRRAESDQFRGVADAIADVAVDALVGHGWRLVRSDPCPHPSAPIGECGCQDITISAEYRPS